MRYIIVQNYRALKAEQLELGKGGYFCRNTDLWNQYEVAKNSRHAWKASNGHIFYNGEEYAIVEGESVLDAISRFSEGRTK